MNESQGGDSSIKLIVTGVAATVFGGVILQLLFSNQSGGNTTAEAGAQVSRSAADGAGPDVSASAVSAGRMPTLAQPVPFERPPVEPEPERDDRVSPASAEDDRPRPARRGDRRKPREQLVVFNSDDCTIRIGDSGRPMPREVVLVDDGQSLSFKSADGHLVVIFNGDDNFLTVGRQAVIVHYNGDGNVVRAADPARVRVEVDHGSDNIIQRDW